MQFKPSVQWFTWHDANSTVYIATLTTRASSNSQSTALQSESSDEFLGRIRFQSTLNCTAHARVGGWCRAVSLDSSQPHFLSVSSFTTTDSVVHGRARMKHGRDHAAHGAEWQLSPTVSDIPVHSDLLCSAYWRAAPSLALYKHVLAVARPSVFHALHSVLGPSRLCCKWHRIKCHQIIQRIFVWDC